MSYRILCDENVDPQTVRYLERDGHDAAHVGSVLGLGTDDPAIAEHAVEHDYALLTNDSDFLDRDRYPSVRVLLFTDNRLQAYELVSIVDRLTDYYPSQSDLPREFYLSESG